MGTQIGEIEIPGTVTVTDDDERIVVRSVFETQADQLAAGAVRMALLQTLWPEGQPRGCPPVRCVRGDTGEEFTGRITGLSFEIEAAGPVVVVTLDRELPNWRRLR
jgi:hypothetical protein